MKRFYLFLCAVVLTVLMLAFSVSAAEIITEGTNYKSDGVTASFTWLFDPDSGKLSITWVNGGAWYNDTQGFGAWKAAHLELVKYIEVDGACAWNKLPLDKSNTGMFDGYPNLVSIWFKTRATCAEVCVGYNYNSYGVFSDNPSLTTVCTTSTYKEGVVDLSGVTYWNSLSTVKNLFRGCSSIKSVIFADTLHNSSVHELAENMFADCTSLVSVKLPHGTTAISETAFSGCSDSLKLYAPDTDSYAVASETAYEAVIDLRNNDINDFAFENADGVQISVCLSESSEYDSEILLEKFGKNTVYYVHPTSQGANTARKMVSDDKALSMQYYPELARDGKETVGSKYEWTFDDATGTVTVNTRYSTTDGGEFYMTSSSNAFYNWKTIWRDAIIRIQIAGNPLWGKMQFNGGYEGAFENLPNLEAVLMTPNCKQWYISTGGLFENCPSLTTFDFGTSWDSIEHNVIDLSGVTGGINADALADMFKGCTSISKVKLGNGSIKAIGSNMFSGCTSLGEFVIGSNIASVGSYAFEGCTSLKCVTLENSDLIITDSTVFPDKAGFYVICPNSESADAITNAYELSVGITLEGIILAEGFQIRLTDYNGLRSIFSVDRELMRKLEEAGFEIAELGALVASEAEYISREGAYIGNVNGEYVANSPKVKKTVIFDGNDFVGKILSSSDEKKTDFAVTVVNFKSNFRSNIYACAYAVIKDTYGNEYYIYSNYGDIHEDYKFINLYETTFSMLKDDANAIHSAKIDAEAVWNTVMQGAIKLGSSYENSINENVSFALVRDGDGYLGFVRASDKAIISESDIEECYKLISDEYTVSKIIKLSIGGALWADEPAEDVTFPYPNNVILAPQYNKEEDQAQHCQGFCTDGEYMYYSLTGFIVKTDMEGNEIGRVHGYNNENGNPGLHMGDPAYHDGKIYVPINYMWWGINYIGVIDTDAFVDSDPDTDGIQPVGREAINILYTPELQDSNFKIYDGDNVSAIKYRVSGCDGVAVGKLPGGGYIDPVSGEEVEDDNYYVILSQLTVLDNSNIYYDDDYKIFYAYDISDIENRIINIDEISSKGDGMEQNAKYVFRVYTGESQYGVQCLDYDCDTGDYYLWCYARPDVTEFPAQNFFVIDGSKKLYMDEIEVGQSVSEDSPAYAEASATAALYADENGNYPHGFMATLKCICGKGDIESHDAVCYGETGYAAKICGSYETLGGSQGFTYLGNDYCYIGKPNDSKDENGYTTFGTKAILYRLNRSLGAWSFKQVEQ